MAALNSPESLTPSAVLLDRDKAEKPERMAAQGRVETCRCASNYLVIILVVAARAYKRREGMQLGKHQNSHVGGRMCMNAHVIDFY